MELWAVSVPQAQPPVLGKREKARQKLWQQLEAAGGQLRLSGTSPALRAAADALAALGVLRLEQRRIDPSRVDVPAEPAPALNQHQAEAFAAMTAATSQGWKAFLLQGVTGSGKTEVYLRLIAEVRARGKGALVLVPEIALTPQLAARFRGRFGDDVAVLHSGLAPVERRAELLEPDVAREKAPEPGEHLWPHLCSTPLPGLVLRSRRRIGGPFLAQEPPRLGLEVGARTRHRDVRGSR